MNHQQHPQRAELCILPGERLSLCRCWLSKTFPLCDGSHKAYREITQDLVGPVVVWGKEEDPFTPPTD